jgi:hypothetical protein
MTGRILTRASVEEKMKTTINKKMKWYIWCTLVSLLALTSGRASAKTMSFCVNVTAEFVDAGGSGKEGYFNNPGLNTYWARLAYLRLTELSNPARTVWDGYLDREGCTAPIEMVAGAEYSAGLQTRAATSGNRAIHIPQDGSQGSCTDAYWCETPYFELTTTFVADPDLESTEGSTYIWDSGFTGPRINLLVLAGRLLYRADEVAYPANATTIIKVDGQGICDGGGMGGVYNTWADDGTGGGHVCAESTVTDPANRHAMTSGAYYKFVIGHEPGHRVQYGHFIGPTSDDYAGGPTATGGWRDDLNHPANQGTYYTGQDGTQYAVCNCDIVEPADGSKAHCIQSKEPIGTALNEGYGHFFSSVLFNDRPPPTTTAAATRDWTAGTPTASRISRNRMMLLIINGEQLTLTNTTTSSRCRNSRG